MSRKNKKDDLDTETTFVNMNVEGFKWYDPTRKANDGRKVKNKVSKKEYRQMVRGAFAAFMPYFLVFLLSMGIVGTLLYLWLR